jgi:CHASE2 domain-containing sensor protein
VAGAAESSEGIWREIPGAIASTPLGLAAWGIWVAIALWIACVDPFDLDSRAETVTESAVQRLLTSRYPSVAADHIAIVATLESDRDDERLNLSYPLSTAVQAQLVKALVAAGARAIFIDAEYHNPPAPQRDEAEALFAAQDAPPRPAPPGHAELVAAIDAARAAGIPVLTGPIGARRDLSHLSAAARQTQISWQADHPSDYPLHNEAGTTAAGDLYLIACAGRAPPQGCSKPLMRAIAEGKAPPLAMRFGNTYPPEQWRFSEAEENAACRTRSTLATFRAELTDGIRPLPCTHHLTVPVSAVLLAQDQFPALARNLRGRIVLIGAGARMGDDHAVPGVGVLPGVAIHAMALDNLLTWGPRYPRWPGNFAGQLGPDEVLKLLALLVLPPGLTLLAARLNRKCRTPRRLAWSTVGCSLAVVAALVGIALLGVILFHWPVSVALMLAGLSALVAQLLSGDSFRSAVRALTGPRSASVLLAVAVAAALLLLAPEVGGLLLMLTVLIGIGFARIRLTPPAGPALPEAPTEAAS